MKKTPGRTEELNSVEDVLEGAEKLAAAREEKELLLEGIDKKKIDDIIMSEDLQKGGTIRIERRGPMDTKFAYLTTVPAEQWETVDRIEWCKLCFGGGDYQCRTFRQNGQMYKMFSFTIDARFKGNLDEEERAALTRGRANGEKDGLNTKLLDMIRTRPPDDGIKMADMLAMMEKATSKSEQSQMMMMTMMMKSMEVGQANMASMMAAMVTAMAGNRSTPNDNTPLLLELIKQKSQPMNETLDMMAKLKQIFEQPPSEKEEKDDMFSKIGRIAGPVLGHFMGQPQPQPAQEGQTATVTTSPPQPAGALPQGAPPPGDPTSKLGGIYAQLPLHYRMMLNMMLNAAEKNSDPSVYVDLIMDQCDPQALGMFRDTLTPPDWCAKLFGDEKLVAHIRPWLDELRELLVNSNGTDSNNVARPEAAGSPVPPGQPAS